MKPQRIELPVLAAGTAFHSIIHCVPGHSFLRIPAASSQVTEKHLETAMTALLIGPSKMSPPIFHALSMRSTTPADYTQRSDGVARRQCNDLVDPAVKRRPAALPRVIRLRSRRQYLCRVRYQRSRYSTVDWRCVRPLERFPTGFGNSRLLD
jgi:hypothetical protein